MAKKSLSKGPTAEEALRDYFLSLGYFVVRSIPYRFRSNIITDLDLWLYKRTSTVSRERVNVDIKRKRTPQAVERFFWAKGLSELLGLDRCIVATTDKRRDPKEFGKLHDILVLDGNFLKRLLEKGSYVNNRLTEEDFLSLLKERCLVDSKLNWRATYENSKQRLLTALDFNGCNLHLNDIHKCMEDYILSDCKGMASHRLLFVHTAYLLITVDYIFKFLAFSDAQERKNKLDEGIRYGNTGKERTEEVLEIAVHLAESGRQETLVTNSELRSEMIGQITSYRAEIVADYFARADVAMNLFKLAKEFESLAFSTAPPRPRELVAELKSVLAVLCDFLSIDRKRIL